MLENITGQQFFIQIWSKKIMLKILSKNAMKKDYLKKRIVTQVEPLKEFYTAENYHNYFELNQNQPYCEYVIAPKIEKFKLKFKSELK